MLQALREIHAVAVLIRFVTQVLIGLAWFWENLLRPVMRTLFWRPLKYLLRKYRLLWDRVVYLKSGHFSRLRAGLMVTATIAAIYVIPQLTLFLLHAGLFLATAKRETVYLTQSQEIYPDHDVHSVKGCEELPCTEQSSIYYRVRPYSFHHAWSLVKRGTLFYPDFVAATVPPGVSRCTTLSYGLRIKLLMRQWDLYPDLLDAVCEPVRPEKT
jgi:hypothetical protein